jgi:hypothetical protein
VLTRGPLRETDAHPAADPNAVDPIASALGADRPTWSEKRDDTEPVHADAVESAAPAPAPEAPPPAAGPIPPVASAAPLTPSAKAGRRSGQPDPTDRD